MKRAVVITAWGCFAVFLTYATVTSAQNRNAAGLDVEVTADGLYRVDDSIMRSAWAKPDLDMSQYERVFLWRAGMDFRQVEEEDTRARGRGQQTYPIGEDRQQEIRELFGEALQADLADLENFELSTGPSRDVLMVEVYLLDVISHVPLEQTITDDITIDSTWEATLIVQVRDSMSDELLARAAERFRSRRGFGESAGAWLHTQQVVRRWSEVLCDRLDELAGIGRQPEP